AALEAAGVRVSPSPARLGTTLTELLSDWSPRRRQAATG
ncbi:succinate--CoA ligase subunit alpha, partial [Labrys sp. LIt4]|nr:succinate--CoA ligase subunit alpha [Labrys sp. LIt4]MDZ5454191.1 succinate--CoA ligase subunit alpha [Labrys sp. ZIDIC5]